MANPDDPTTLAADALGLRAFAASLAHGRDPDDLVQEAAVSALRTAQPPADAQPWLRRVLRNHARQRHRGEQRRLRREAHVVVEAAVESSLTGDPEQALFRAQLLATLGQALAELDEPYRHTMRERFVRGLSAAEIARATDTPPTTVRSRIQHALDQIRGVLDERFGGRSQWCPALMIAAGLPGSDPLPNPTPAMTSPSPAGGTMITKSMMVAATALVGAAIAWGRPDAPESTRSVTIADGEADGRDAPGSIALEPTAVEDARAAAGAKAPRPVIATPSSPRPGAAEAFAAALASVGTEQEGQPLLLDLHGDDETDPERADRLGHFSVCEAMVLPTTKPKIVAFDYEGLGHDVLRMDVVRDDVGRPEVVECLRTAFAELREEKRAEYPDYDEPNANFIGAIFGRTPPSAAGAMPSPDDFPLATDAFPRRGDDDAAVELVVCGDYDSEHTRHTAETIAELETYYGGELRVRWLQAPLLAGPASLRARAAVAAQAQGKFWELHARLMADDTILDEAGVLALATEAGLDAAQLQTALSSPETLAALELQHRTCQAHGARSTPYFIVAGEPVAGAVPFDRLAGPIEAALRAHDGR